MQTNIGKLRILILEDNLADVQLIVQTLKSAGLEFDYLCADTRETFLSAFVEYDPDIILSDYGLPNYNGLAAYEDCKENGALAPFILVTGSMPDEIAVECLKAGVDDYILKDRLSRLPEAIANALDKKRLEGEKLKVIKDLVVSQRRLAEAERLAKVGNWEWDVPSGKMIWSDEMYRIYEVLKRNHKPDYSNFLAFFGEEDKEKVSTKIKKILARQAFYLEARAGIKTGEGNTKVLHFIIKASKTANGSDRLKVFGTIQDITMLHSKERELRELTEELECKVKERTKELTRLNERLVFKNAEMTNSLRYAQLIQRALLSKLAECRVLFPESFVLWLPKDIVSGDFYWHHQDGDKYYIAAVDCTGHGVPGAFMSMIGHQLLNKIVLEEGCSEPAEILERLDVGIIKALQNETGREMGDGMDIALCRVDKAERKLTFAGALRPLFYHDGKKLKEINGSRFPLGGLYSKISEKEFKQSTVSYKPGDNIYLSSDGYYSQFGGNMGKKMMKRRFTNLLSDVGTKPIEQQYDILKEHLDDWKGKEEQVDDVLVIGIKL